MKLPRSWPRLAAPLILGLALASFLLPWLTVSADRRRGDATGLELVLRAPDYSGRYVHLAWQGEVEAIVGSAQLWALPAFVAAALAALLVLLPWRPAWWAGLALVAAGAVSLLLWVQATTSAYRPPIPDRHAGFWLAFGLIPLAAVPILMRLLEPVPDPGARRAPDWLASTGGDAR